MKNFTEIQSTHKNSSTHRMSTGNFDDDFSSYNLNSSDDSFNSNNSCSSSSEKKNDVLKNYNLLLNDGDSKASEHSLSEIDSHSKTQQHKSFQSSIIKFLKNSMKNKPANDQHQSILRRPTQYVHVRGISGLPIRVIKASSSPRIVKH